MWWILALWVQATWGGLNWWKPLDMVWFIFMLWEWWFWYTFSILSVYFWYMNGLFSVYKLLWIKVCVAMNCEEYIYRYMCILIEMWGLWKWWNLYMHNVLLWFTMRNENDWNICIWHNVRKYMCVETELHDLRLS